MWLAMASSRTPVSCMRASRSLRSVGGAIASEREKMQELNDASALWTEAMGEESMLSGLSRIGSMLSGVFSSVGRGFTAAADKEDFAAQLGVMMNSSLDGSALVDSLECLAKIFSTFFAKNALTSAVSVVE